MHSQIFTISHVKAGIAGSQRREVRLTSISMQPWSFVIRLRELIKYTMRVRVTPADPSIALSSDSEN